MNIIPIIIGAALLGGVIVLFARIAKSIGVECVFCGGRSLKMDQLPESERSKLRTYFWNVEKRVPYSDSVYVCLECHKVNDDYIRPVGMHVVCKSCRHTSNLDRRMTCDHCGSQFEWVTIQECGQYRFLLPSDMKKDANTNLEPISIS